MKPKYQYHVKTWGGFYNEEYRVIHGLEDGDFLFDTREARHAFITHRKEIEKRLGAKSLILRRTEGYHCDIRTVCHRICEWEGVEYYSTYDLGVNYSKYDAEYWMKYKWYPSFNDYPLGEDFEHYDSKHFKVKAEWITGAFHSEH
jgi:hypothetical protein